MAYSDGDRLFIVEGNLAGGEIWSNTWAVSDGPAASSEGLAAIFHEFYESQEDNFHTSWTLERISIRDLFTGDTSDAGVTPFNGNDSTNDPLPTEVAVRVSLSAPGNVRGGPYLSGWTAGALTATGTLDTTYKTALVTAVDSLQEALVAVDGTALSIHRPGPNTVVAATSARVGGIFDVIRNRRNALSEAYTLIPF